MTKSKMIQYYAKDSLELKTDASGAGFWGIALDNTMLTYFEVGPDSSFDRHCHESEQITMVIEGILFFEAEGKDFSVKEGDAIAIPSNIPHRVYTKDKHVKAVDAWSPVRSEYVTKKV